MIIKLQNVHIYERRHICDKNVNLNMKKLITQTENQLGYILQLFLKFLEKIRYILIHFIFKYTSLLKHNSFQINVFSLCKWTLILRIIQ